MAFWLVKTEPHVFAIQDFLRMPDRVSGWDGVRNYQARNNLRSMSLGDEVFLYHSNVKERGIVGLATVVREAYPDETALDPGSASFDPRSDRANPRWYQVDLQLVEIFPRVLELGFLKTVPELASMVLLSKAGQRLSVQPVTGEEFRIIRGLG
ncbi:EVE domain-containing protein [Desulfurispirillum indicum]|uniref:EVE domain-containing protein n=1 Tax=Desulfurispirillum indicum TaxID=936456 RepID=UPI001CFB4E8C|nr:EVE domain-containing protein [Desulfurispirillum indicum]